MGFGRAASDVAEHGGNTLQVPGTAQFIGSLRTINSPRLMPFKRPLEEDDFSLPTCEKVPSILECPPQKQRKLDADKDELQRNKDILSEILPSVTEEADDKVQKASESDKIMSLRGPRPNRSLTKAVDTAMALHREALTVYTLEKDLRSEEKADVLAEEWAAEHYEELKSAIVSLLPWAGETKVATSGSYDMLKFRGRKTKRKELSRRQLQHFRREGEQARAWEALCAVFSVISSRKEKNWLEQTDVESELKDMLKKLPRCKSKRSATRKAAIRELVAKIIEDGGAGAFSPYLIDDRSEHTVTFAQVSSGSLPATHMTTRRLPLWDALKTMDDDGPLRGDAMEKQWCHAAGREFALQDLVFGQPKNSRKDRKCAQHLEADTQFRDLLRSKKPVVLLDTLAALAPRDVCKDNGISKIVQAELTMLLREAKARGEAVVFSLGSDDPHKLAERVYLRPPLADYGMRVGCLRWRESSDAPWAREFAWDDRITLCLQMP